jgi:hypothetical protein
VRILAKALGVLVDASVLVRPRLCFDERLVTGPGLIVFLFR